MHSGMVYEGIGTTWDHQESSLVKSTFGRRPPRELRTHVMPRPTRRRRPERCVRVLEPHSTQKNTITRTRGNS